MTKGSNPSFSSKEATSIAKPSESRPDSSRTVPLSIVPANGVPIEVAISFIDSIAVVEMFSFVTVIVGEPIPT